MFEIWKSLVEAVMEAGGNDDSLRRIQSNAKLRRKLAEDIVGKKEEESAPAQPSRLTHIASHIIPATTAVFECTQNFARYMWDDLKSWFVGKREDPKPETTLTEIKYLTDK